MIAARIDSNGLMRCHKFVEAAGIALAQATMHSKLGVYNNRVPAKQYRFDALDVKHHI
jgi:hypothetical protein